MTSQPYPTGDSTPFPYESPYPQQIDFMDAILQTLKRHSEKSSPDGAAVMFLESPTGTGKSMSLACAAVAWLRYTEQQDLAASNDDETKAMNRPSTAMDWLNDWVSPEEQDSTRMAHQARERATAARAKLQNELSSIRTKLKIDQKDNRLRERRENLVRSAVTAAKMAERNRPGHKKRIVTPDAKRRSEQDFCLQEYSSDTERDTLSDEGENDANVSNYENAPESLIEGGLLDGSGEKRRPAIVRPKVLKTHSIGSVLPGSGFRKIIYAARTHSQLSQFVGELRRTYWGSTLRVVALGGRQTLCGNPTVKGTGRFPKSESTISEACLDLKKGVGSGQKRSKENKGGCPLLASKIATSTLALHMLAQPSDIEDAARLGNASHTCAYYASRESLAAAEVVVVPYSMLLSKQARSAVGLSLNQSFVVIDEAHNLPEALRSLHLCRLTLPVIRSALEALATYTNKYASRLAGRNLFYLGQIRRCLNAFIKHLTQPPPRADRNQMISSAELLLKLRLDNINLFKLLRYLEHSRLSQKLLGFMNTTKTENTDSTENPTEDSAALSKHVSPLSIVETFLERLASESTAGKVVTEWPSAQEERDPRSSNAVRHAALRYVLLQPAAHFQTVLDEAYAVALVGGTLRPFVHVAAELMEDPDIVKEAAHADLQMQSTTSNTSSCYTSKNITAFSCDHVVRASNISLTTVSQGPTGIKLDFRHQNRKTNAVCDELGRTLVRLCQAVPHGVVAFLPSYSYEAHLMRRWEATGLIRELKRCKRVHREPKSSQLVESALKSYARDAQSGEGGLLLSVVGGKMSEGINFANDMARCVVVVGLPYPDITDPELKEKMSIMDRTAMNQSHVTTISGQSYYQNLCMRAVNQSVGRALRHANDYASIVLVDARYTTDRRIWQGLPLWLRKGSSGPGEAHNGHGAFGNSMARLREFFKDKN